MPVNPNVQYGPVANLDEMLVALAELPPHTSFSQRVEAYEGAPALVVATVCDCHAQPEYQCAVITLDDLNRPYADLRIMGPGDMNVHMFCALLGAQGINWRGAWQPFDWTPAQVKEALT